MGTKEKMIATLRETTNNKSAISKDENYGFGDLSRYNNRELFFVKFAIEHFRGLSNKIKIAKSLYIVHNLINCVVDDENNYEDIGRYCCDILEDCNVIRFAYPKEDETEDVIRDVLCY